MNKPDIDTIKKLILDAPIGRYVGDRGARIFAEHACCTTELKDGNFLFKKGETTTSFYIVATGRLALVKIKKKKDSTPRILHILEQGDLVGELSFIDDTYHSSTVIAVGDAKVLQFKAEDIRPLILQEPQLMFDFMRAVIKRVHHTVASVNKQMGDLSDYISTAGKGRL